LISHWYIIDISLISHWYHWYIIAVSFSASDLWRQVSLDLALCSWHGA
jgi:hypothetical protein